MDVAIEQKILCNLCICVCCMHRFYLSVCISVENSAVAAEYLSAFLIAGVVDVGSKVAEPSELQYACI